MKTLYIRGNELIAFDEAVDGKLDRFYTSTLDIKKFVCNTIGDAASAKRFTERLVNTGYVEAGKVLLSKSYSRIRIESDDFIFIEGSDIPFDVFKDDINLLYARLIEQRPDNATWTINYENDQHVLATDEGISFGYTVTQTPNCVDVLGTIKGALHISHHPLLLALAVHYARQSCFEVTYQQDQGIHEIVDYKTLPNRFKHAISKDPLALSAFDFGDSLDRLQPVSFNFN